MFIRLIDTGAGNCGGRVIGCLDAVYASRLQLGAQAPCASFQYGPYPQAVEGAAARQIGGNHARRQTIHRIAGFFLDAIPPFGGFNCGSPGAELDPYELNARSKWRRMCGFARMFGQRRAGSSK